MTTVTAEALTQLDEAQRLEPSSTAVLSSRALAEGLNGRRDEAVEMIVRSQGGHPIASARYALATLSLQTPRNLPVFLEQSVELGRLDRSESRVRLFFQSPGCARARRRAGDVALHHGERTAGSPSGPRFTTAGRRLRCTRRRSERGTNGFGPKQSHLNTCGIALDPGSLSPVERRRLSRASENASFLPTKYKVPSARSSFAEVGQ